MRRFVLDASVLLSAALAKPDSNPSLLLDAVRSGQIEMVVCPQLNSEVASGLQSRYFRDRITAEERAAIPAMLEALGVLASDPESPPRILRDPADDYLVALAQATAAEAIITGDRDLLDHDGLVPRAISARQAREEIGLGKPTEA